MEKLSNDEILEVMINLKRIYEKQISDLKINYEKRINDLNDKSDALGTVCWEYFGFDMTNYDRCCYCNKSIYDGDFYEHTDDVEFVADTYIKCCKCNKKFCYDCNEKLIEKNKSLYNLAYFNLATCNECNK